MFVVLVIAVAGNFHITCGGQGGTHFCGKESWGLSDTFVDLDEYVGVPLIALTPKAKVVRALVRCEVISFPATDKAPDPPEPPRYQPDPDPEYVPDPAELQRVERVRKVEAAMVKRGLGAAKLQPDGLLLLTSDRCEEVRSRLGELEIWSGAPVACVVPFGDEQWRQ